MRDPYSRAAFERQRAVAKQVERRDGAVLAVASVGLGLGQLPLIRWAEGHLAPKREIRLEGAVFLAYVALVGWLLWRYKRRMRAASPTCPQCGARLQGMSERVAAATGKCDGCGGQVIG